ncbi:MAG TPA: TlpA disulfide reductase family protein [Mycobacterium sp.]|nr:TlpA disulfide reductase family protein [Mycobacterium sp.]
MSRSTRWTIAVVAVAAALVAGLVGELRRTTSTTATSPTTAERPRGDAGGALSDARKQADLLPCPTGTADQGPSALRGVVVDCAADGNPVDAARVLAGRQVVLNLWAYWCAPCRAELPAMAEYQRRMGSAAMVVTVHQDENEAAALALLAQLGVRLPTLQDGSRRIAAALRVPNVMPATVLLAPDGSVARILPRAFASADEIAAAVDDQGR